ncbi:Gloverin [Eumeta japonica]|uniref:Gloverin n=1 Tax=Eumeta variegata TaxID=151549 RepID=A0A4C1VFW9_EUMVA|nr:Gloverin [Eumeta japonica]
MVFITQVKAASLADFLGEHVKPLVPGVTAAPVTMVLDSRSPHWRWSSANRAALNRNEKMWDSISRQSGDGKGVYEKNIFDDSRGKLDGRVQGTRVLGPFEDSSHVGGGLTWETNHAVSTLDLNKEIGGRTRLDATYGGKWRLDPRTDFSLGAGYSQTFPGSGPQFGINGKLTFPG